MNASAEDCVFFDCADETRAARCGYWRLADCRPKTTMAEQSGISHLIPSQVPTSQCKPILVARLGCSCAAVPAEGRSSQA